MHVDHGGTSITFDVPDEVSPTTATASLGSGDDAGALRLVISSQAEYTRIVIWLMK
jgi:hypothetical protein